ncbi:MAG: glycosyltransferase family 39 protein [Thermodesulfobacteriota bacterium]
MKSDFHPFLELAQAVQGAYNPKRALVVGICAVAGFVLVVNSSWVATPDSALYLELGESLAQGKGYVFNGEPHTYVPPGFPFLVAAVVAEFGKGFLEYRVLMALLGLGTAALGVLLVARLHGRDLALLVGGLFAVNHVLLENSTLTTSDVPFALVVLAGLHALVSAASGARISRPWVLVAGLLIGLAPLFRVNGWGVLPAAALYLLMPTRFPEGNNSGGNPLSESFPGEPLLKKGCPPDPPPTTSEILSGSHLPEISDEGTRTGITRPWDAHWRTRLVWVAALFVVSVIPGALWDVWRSSQPASFSEGSYYQAVSGRAWWLQLWVMADSLWNYVPETSYALTGVAVKDVLLEFVVPVLTLVGWVSAVRRGESLWAPLVAIQYAGLLLSSAGSRYLIAFLPGLYLFFALGVLEFFQWISQRLHDPVDTRSTSGSLLVGAFVILAVLNMGHNVKTVVQSRYALEPNAAERSRDLPFFEASRWLQDNDPDAVVMSMHPRVLHYLSGCPTVELIRSGVPENLAWVDSPRWVAGLVEEQRPAYLFSDAKDEPSFAIVQRGVHEAGFDLKKIPLKKAGAQIDKSGGGRFNLWKLEKSKPVSPLLESGPSM